MNATSTASPAASGLPPRAQVARDLADALTAYTAAQAELMRVTAAYVDQRARLQLAEDLVLLAGDLDGKNEQIRGAQLRQATAQAREALQVVDVQRVLAGMDVDGALERLTTCRALVRLVSGGQL